MDRGSSIKGISQIILIGLTILGIIIPLLVSFYNDNVETTNARTLKTNIDNEIQKILKGSFETTPANIHIYPNIQNINASGSVITIVYSHILGGLDKLTLDYTNNLKFASIDIEGYSAGREGDYTIKLILRADRVLVILFQKS